MKKFFIMIILMLTVTSIAYANTVTFRILGQDNTMSSDPSKWGTFTVTGSVYINQAEDECVKPVTNAILVQSSSNQPMFETTMDDAVCNLPLGATGITINSVNYSYATKPINLNYCRFADQQHPSTFGVLLSYTGNNIAYCTRVYFLK